jgi:hypothetical protein
MIHSLRLIVPSLCFAALLSLSMVHGQDENEETAKGKSIPRATPADTEADGSDSSSKDSSSKVRPLSVTVDLITNTKIVGTLTDTTTLEMKTSFGSASIPLSEVAGIRFADADEPTTAVVLLNGDVLTGATDVKLVTVETEWGSASINGQSILSILLVPGLNWQTEVGINGKRWNLVNSEKNPPRPNPSQPTASANPATGNSSTRAPLNVPNGELVQPQQLIRNP